MSQVIGQVWREVIGCRNWPVMRVPQFIALRRNAFFPWSSWSERLKQAIYNVFETELYPLLIDFTSFKTMLPCMCDGVIIVEDNKQGMPTSNMHVNN